MLKRPRQGEKSMFRHLTTNMTLGAVLYGAVLVAPISAASEKQRAFTHVALIPDDSDMDSVQFEKVKTIKVRATAADSKACEQRAAREHRSASTDCPKADGVTKAYEVTYSYMGQPMASDEYGNRHFTFQVYFRPDELPAAVQKLLASGKPKRAELAPYFAVSNDLDQKKDDENQPPTPSGYVAVKVQPTTPLRVSGPASADIKPSAKD
jgi:hypothetical protein